MKTIYAIILFLGVFSIAKGQPTITQFNYPQAGDSYSAQANISAPWTPGTSSGPWDFSALNGFVSLTFSYSTPASTPYSATFASSQIALNPLPFNYTYFLSSPTEYQISGTVTQPGAPPATVRPYTDPHKIITFPFTYLDEFKDTARTSTYPFGSSGNKQRRIIYSQTKADGYGNLTVPGGTVYSNTLRVMITDSIIDSTFNSSMVFLTKDISIDTNYYWLSHNFKPHVFVFTKSVQDPQGAATTTVIAQYFSNPGTPTGIMNAYDSYFSIYPNPFSSELFVEVDKEIFASNPDLKISIMNNKGVEVMQSPMESKKTVIHRNNLSSGLYFYSISSKGKILSTGKLNVH